MAADPVKSEVLAWLWADTNRTAPQAVERFWGPLDEDAVQSKASLVRMWASRARRLSDPDVADDRPPRPATPASDDRIAWLRDQVAALAGDIEVARSKRQWGPVTQLTRCLAEVRAELDAAVRIPPPTAAPGPPRPIISDAAIAAMTPEQLEAAIVGLGRAMDLRHHVDPSDAEVEEEVARSKVDAAAREARIRPGGPAELEDEIGDEPAADEEPTPEPARDPDAFPGDW